MKCPKCNFDNPSDTRFCGNCATPLPPSEEISISKTDTLEAFKKELTTGSTFAGRYQVIEEVGRGGMGNVYKVLDKEIKEKVALKLLNPEIAADNKTIERFRNELKFARKVGHRNVCRMYDLSKEEGTYYIIMEYVHGEDLKNTIRRIGQLPIGKSISIAKQVCEGLAEAHRLGVVHRDLKPQNIMVDEDGNVRIMDFGIARFLKAKGVTDSGVIIGTPEYMSPEQVEGKEADQRSDIYSLGVILYEMLTGRVPFEGDTPLSIAVKHKSETTKDPREVNAQIPEDLSHVILRCMEKDKSKRYQGAEELLSELNKIEKKVPTAERILPKKKFRIEKVGGIKWRKIIPYISATILLILLIVIGFYFFTGRGEAIDSIAVLPLENLSGDPQQEYFADGMTDALISNLAKIGALTVISRTSVMRYKGTETSLPEIARKLNVDAVVEGTVLRSGERIRITAQLIDARTDRNLWADSYERDLRDILALQNEVARAIAQEIKVTLTPEEQMQLESARPIHPKAYQAYLKGHFHWNKRSEKDLKKAIEYFGQAIALDRNYALAYSGLADSYVVLPYYSSFQIKEGYLKAKEAALKALEIDDMLAEAHTSLAFFKTLYDWDWEGAEKEFKRAIELNPGYAIARHWYSNCLMYTGRFDEALAEIKQALHLDPLSLIINRDLGELFFYARQYDKAIEQYLKTIEMDPNFIYVHLDLAIVYLQKSMYDEALTELQKEPSEIWSGIAYTLMGKRNEAKQVLDDLLERSKHVYISPYLLALLYFTLGDKDQGFEWLNKAYEEHNSWLIYLKIEPLFDVVRSDSRYTKLLKKMGFEK